MTTPTVSVVMSVHNGEDFLHRAIVSILQQTWGDFEFILIDDASTDATATMIHAWANKDRRIIPVVNESNIGLTRSLNKGIRLARGRWIARMDADDIARPERLEKQLQFLADHPSVGLLGTAAWLIDAEGVVKEPCHINPATHTEICWWIILTNPFFHASVLFDRTIALNNPYDESIRYGQDFELWGRLLQVTQGANLTQPLVQLGRHENRLSVRHGKEQLDQGISIMQKRLLTWVPDGHWETDTIRQMRQIIQSDWPTPHETSKGWECVLTLFSRYSRQPHLDQIIVKQIRQQLIRHVLVSLSSSKELQLSFGLMKHLLFRFPLPTMEELIKQGQKKMASCWRS
ncbi:MAG: glycosyltransferase [Magnetococcales bacterium]|nr:glycosyltransferase [Magnetococcales bacterium]